MENNPIPESKKEIETISDFTALQLQVLEFKKSLNLMLDQLILELETMENKALEP